MSSQRKQAAGYADPNVNTKSIPDHIGDNRIHCLDYKNCLAQTAKPFAFILLTLLRTYYDPPVEWEKFQISNKLTKLLHNQGVQIFYHFISSNTG